MNFNDWPEIIFDELIESVSETQKYRIEKMVLINTSDVYDGKVLNHKYVDTNDIPGQFKKKFQYGDILYSEIRPANKRYAFVDFDSRDYIASTKLMVLRNKKALVNNRFLFHVLKSSNVINELQTIAESRSGTFPQITFSELARLKIKLPKLSEQIKIAQMLDDLDYKIELNNKINKTLEEMAQAIFKSWFVDFEPFRDGEFFDSELGSIPKSWIVVELGEFLKMRSGYSFKGADYNDEGAYKIVTIKNVEDGKFQKREFSRIDYLPSNLKDFQRINEGDILISLTGNVGRVCLAYGEDLLLNQRVGKIEKNPLSSYFYYLWCNSVDKDVKLDRSNFVS